MDFPEFFLLSESFWYISAIFEQSTIQGWDGDWIILNYAFKINVCPNDWEKEMTYHSQKGRHSRLEKAPRSRCFYSFGSEVTEPFSKVIFSKGWNFELALAIQIGEDECPVERLILASPIYKRVLILIRKSPSVYLWVPFFLVIFNDNFAIVQILQCSKGAHLGEYPHNN